MAKVVSFEIVINGVSKQINNLAELEQTLKEVKKDAKEIDFDSAELTKYTQAQAKLQAQQKKFRDEVKKQTREIQAQDNTYRGLSARLINLRAEAKDVAVQFGLNSKEFKALGTDVNLLDKRLKEIDSTLGQNQRNVGNYGEAFVNAFDKIKGQLPGFVSDVEKGLNTAANLGIVPPGFAELPEISGRTARSLAAAGAAIGVLATASEYIKDITLQYEQLNATVERATNLQGENIQTATVGIKTLSETFDKDFNEVLTAANNLSEGFGIDFNKGLDLIKTGLQSGADAQGDFLDKLREYPVQFANAGFSAEDFIKLTTQEVKGGIYDDKLIDSIKEADLALKEFTTTQIDALNEAIGSEATKKLNEQIREGSLTTKDAILTIAEGVKDTGADIQDLQTLTADVFKGAGEDAGGFGAIIEQVTQGLAVDIENLVDVTDAYTIRQNNLFNANLDLNESQQNLAAQFAGTGTSVDQLKTKLKALAIDALDAVIRGFRVTKEIYEDEGFFASIFASGDAIAAKRKEITDRDKKALQEVQDGATKAAAQAKKLQEDELARLEAQARRKRAIAKKEKEERDLATKAAKEARAEEKKIRDAAKQGEEGSIKALTDDISKLKQVLNTSNDDNVINNTLDQLAIKTDLLTVKTQNLKKGLIDAGITLDTGTIEDPALSESAFVDTNEAAITQEESELLKVEAAEAASQQKRLEQEKEFQDQKNAIIASAAGEAAELIGAFASGQVESFEDFQRQFLGIALDALKRFVQLQIVGATAASLASPESIATFGVAGLAKAALLTGLIEAAFGLAQRAISGFKLGGFTGSGNDTDAAGIVHRNEYVIPAPVLRTPQGMAIAEQAEAMRSGNLKRTVSPHQFAVGGLASAPIAPIPGASNIRITLDDESIERIEQANERGTYKGSNKGTNEGISEGTERGRLLTDLQQLTEV